MLSMTCEVIDRATFLAEHFSNAPKVGAVNLEGDLHVLDRRHPVGATLRLPASRAARRCCRQCRVWRIDGVRRDLARAAARNRRSLAGAGWPGLVSVRGLSALARNTPCG